MKNNPHLGTTHPLGAALNGGGANFSLCSRSASRVDPARGLRFDASKVLLDPYGRGVVMPKDHSREAAAQPGDNAATAMKSVVTDPTAYDREGDAPLRRPSARTVIYERHVDGFTLNDLVSYNDKHNEANGEENRDGASANALIGGFGP
jgi:glycogen operon protein